MSSIEKLLISGIRSFDPQIPSVIEFYTPLTIILGHNGAGKTTIIECLKYATTGEQPPNSKGGTFVNDPKISKECEVRAQIKLKFRDVNRREIVCTRSLLLTQKKTTTSLKTLESVLLTKDEKTNQQVSISSRCSDLDKQIPLLLGVESAILDNVIFCHQENSVWPLSEASILKKKFDSIFSATKYIKALENIKSIKKEKETSMKMEKQKLEFTLREKDRIYECKLEMDKINKDMEEKKETIDKIIKESKEKETELTEKRSKMKEIEELQKQRSKLETERMNIENMIKGIDIKEICYDDREVCKEIKAVNLQIEDKTKNETFGKQEKAKVKQEYDECELIIKEHENQKCLNENKIAEHAVIKKEFKDFLNKLKDEYQNLEFNDDDVLEKLEKIKLSNEEEHSLKMKMNDQDVASISKTSSDTKLKLNVTTEQKANLYAKINEIQTLVSKLKQMHSEIKTIDMDGVLRMEADVKNKELLLIEKKNYLIKNAFNEKIKGLEAKTNEIEKERVAIFEKISNINRKIELKIKHDLLKQTIKEKKTELTESMELLSKQNLVSCELSSDIKLMEARVLDKTKEALESAKNAQRKINESNLKKSLLNEKLNNARKKNNEMQSETKLLLDTNADLISIDECDEQIKQTQSQLDTLLGSINQNKEKAKLYSVFVSEIESSHHKCPLCEHPFQNEKEALKTVEKLKTKSNSGHLINKDLDKKELFLKQKLSKLTGLRSVLAQISANNTIIGTNNTEIDQILTELNALEEIISQSLEYLAQNSNNSKILQSLTSTILNINTKNNEIAQLNKTLESFTQSLGIEAMCEDTVEELETKYSSLNNHHGLVTMEIKNIKHELETSETQITTISQQAEETKKQIESALNYQSEKNRLLNEIKSNEKLISEHYDSIKSIDAELEDLKKISSELDLKLSHATSLKDRETHNYYTYRNTLTNSIAKCAQFLEQISSYDKMHLNSQLRKCLETIHQTSIKRTQLANKINTIESSALKLEAEVSILKLKLHELHLNMQWISLHKQLSSTNLEIDQLDSKLRDTISGISVEHLSGLINTLANEINNYKLTVCKVEGELTQVNEYKTKLAIEADQYTEVYNTYYHQIVIVQTLKMLLVDLDKYMSSLEKAVVDFHSIKMEEINRTIKDIWINTYQGNDIDTIKIHSLSEKSGSNSTSKGYNYKVVMISNGVELDMRGRCSAGQKMLASIVIRLALAESFGSNCGIIALDEPTTNLDNENIQSLAKSLSNIIDYRRNQKNFQLIIITHNTSFISLLRSSDLSDYCFFVRKDKNKHSTIERIEMSKIMA